MHSAHTFHYHNRMLLTQGTEGSPDGRHSHGRPFRSRGKERRHWKSKDIGRNFCHRVMASSRSSQSRFIRLSLGRSRDPCLNRLHDTYIDSPLTQTYHERRRDECFPDPRIGRGDKDPSRAGIANLLFASSHRLVSSGLNKTMLVRENFYVRHDKTILPQDAQKVRPARPQRVKGRRRTLWGTLRTRTMRERSWRAFSASC